MTALAFYYKTLQDRPDQQRIITEEINIPSPPDQTMKSLPEQGVVPRQADMPESIATPAPPPPDAVSTVAVQEEPPQSPPLQPEQPPKPTLAFTVSVGTFKDKANAIALTSKLANKGYPASTAHSTKREHFRVIVGSFPTREEAIPMARILAKKENLPTAVVTTSFP